jgi:pilus assembly protein Flp/PilA
MESIMSTFVSAAKTFIADEDGVTAIEYGLIAALIGVAIAGAVQLVGNTLNGLFTTINNKL